MLIRRSSALVVGLVVVVGSAYAGKPGYLDGATLHLTPAGSAIVQKEIALSLPAGESRHTLGLVPPALAAAALQVSVVDGGDGAWVGEWSLVGGDDPPAEGACQELEALVTCERAGQYTLRVVFPLTGLTWKGTNVCRPLDDKSAELTSTVSLENQSGLGLDGVEVRVPRGLAAPPAPQDKTPRVNWNPYRPVSKEIRNPLGDVASAGLSTTTFALERAITLGPHESKSISVGHRRLSLAPRRFAVRTVFPEDLPQSSTSVSSAYSWNNAQSQIMQVIRLVPRDAESKLRMQVVPGNFNVRRFEADSFIDVNAFDWQANEDGARLYLLSQDLHCRRNQIRHTCIFTGHVYMVAMEVEVANRLNCPIEVDLLEPLFEGARVTVSDASLPYTMEDEHTLQFSLALPARGRTTITYQVRYELE